LFSIIILGAIVSMFSCNKALNTNLTDPNGVGIDAISGKDVFAQALVSTAANKVGANITTGSNNYDYCQNWMGYWARNTDWAASGLQAQIENFQLPIPQYLRL